MLLFSQQTLVELRTATLRVPLMYGESDSNFIPQTIESIRKNQWKTRIVPNEKIFEFVYVKAAAEAHILAAEVLLSKQKTWMGKRTSYQTVMRCPSSISCVSAMQQLVITHPKKIFRSHHSGWSKLLEGVKSLIILNLGEGPPCIHVPGSPYFNTSNG